MAIPNPDPMKAIADWLGVRIAWLRDGEGPMRAEPLPWHVAEKDENHVLAENVIVLTSEEQRLLNEAYKKMSHEDRKRLLDLAKRFTELKL